MSAIKMFMPQKVTLTIINQNPVSINKSSPVYRLIFMFSISTVYVNLLLILVQLRLLCQKLL